MKIVHVISALTKGGGERIAVELANIAAEKGNDVTIIAAWPVDPVQLQNSISSKVNIIFIGKTRKLAFLKIFPWILKHRTWICSHDILHCHLTYGAAFGSVVCIVLKKILRKKKPVIIETYHAVGMPVPKFNRWIHSRMLLLRNGVILMAKDPYWNKFIQKHPKLKIQMIPNGISISSSNNNFVPEQDLRKKTGIPDCKYLVGTVSMLRPDRRPTLYIPIFRDIYDALGKDVHFVLGGDGVEFDKVKSLIDEYELTAQVHMPGLVHDPAQIISQLDIYVSISVGETTGISMLEAAMCKVPVVGIQLVENYQVKIEDWVWSHADTKEVAKRIIFLLQNMEERNKLAADQYKYVNAHFTTEAMYASYASFYQELLIKK